MLHAGRLIFIKIVGKEIKLGVVFAEKFKFGNILGAQGVGISVVVGLKRILGRGFC